MGAYAYDILDPSNGHESPQNQRGLHHCANRLRVTGENPPFPRNCRVYAQMYVAKLKASRFADLASSLAHLCRRVSAAYHLNHCGLCGLLCYVHVVIVPFTSPASFITRAHARAINAHTYMHMHKHAHMHMHTCRHPYCTRRRKSRPSRKATKVWRKASARSD